MPGWSGGRADSAASTASSHVSAGGGCHCVPSQTTRGAGVADGVGDGLTAAGAKDWRLGEGGPQPAATIRSRATAVAHLYGRVTAQRPFAERVCHLPETIPLAIRTPRCRPSARLHLQRSMSQEYDEHRGPLVPTAKTRSCPSLNIRVSPASCLTEALLSCTHHSRD
jgi:hypothetical protein